MKKILITGGAGYIGSKLTTELINSGYKVTVIDRLDYSQNSINHLIHHKNFKLIVKDCREKKLIKSLIKQNDIIIPLAGLVGAPLCEKNKKEAKEINYECIKHIVKILHKKYILIQTQVAVGKKNK